jgi:hypothetical protein
MSQMNTNRVVPKAPQAPALPKPKTPAAKPAASAKPATLAAAKAQLKPTPGPKAAAHKPGSGQESFAEATKNGRKPGGTLKPNPGKK